MDLPAILRGAIDEALSGIAAKDLSHASERLSVRYRGEVSDGFAHLNDDIASRAYLAARMPATYAAIRAAMRRAAEIIPDCSPRSLLDIGAGPGTAMWAAKDCWPDIDSSLLVEASPSIRQWGERFSPLTGIGDITWRAADITVHLNIDQPRDLVTLAYVLSELPEPKRDALVEAAWRATGSLFIIVEPGTPSGWQRILRARDRLIGIGAHIAAPCPHHLACPLIAPDWCHFAQRLARTRMHRIVKHGDVPWEDEKYIYLAASREPMEHPHARVIAPPRSNKTRIELKLCKSDGTSALQSFERRDKANYKIARRRDWGDAM
jgi:ribosomal protein RSM22 (predicted rRNA methylase)